MGFVNVDYVDFSRSRLPALQCLGHLPQFSTIDGMPISSANRFFISQSRAWSANTIRTYSEHLLSFLNWLACGEAEVEECDQHTLLVYADALCQDQGRGVGLSWNTVNRRVRLAGAFLGWCTKNGFLEIESAALAVSEKNARGAFSRGGYPRRCITKPIRFVELSVAIKCIKALEENPGQHAIRNALIGRLMLECGLRISEVLSLQVCDLPTYLKEQKFGLCRIIGKGQKERPIAIPRQLLHDLYAYVQTERQCIYERLTRNQKKTVRALFLTSQGASPSRCWIENIFQKVSVLINHKITPHMMRHTFGTYHYHLHKDLVLLRQLMGHSNLHTTEQLYVHTAVLSSFSENFSELIDELNRN